MTRMLVRSPRLSVRPCVLVYLDEHLTWKSHTSHVHVNAKVSRSIFAVNQIKNILPKSCLRTLYFSLIHPHFSYGLLAWGIASITALKSSIMLQKRAIRNINRDKYRAHREPLFNSSQILKLTDLYEYQVTLFMFDFISKKLPISFLNTFKFNRDNENARITRQSDLFVCDKMSLPVCKQIPIILFSNHMQ